MSRGGRNSRRRYAYTQEDLARYLVAGTLFVCSAAALGYVFGRYSERRQKQQQRTLQRPARVRSSCVDRECAALLEQRKPITYDRDYTVLIYGDSTTWGYDADKGTRLPSHQRYPCILENLLNENAAEIEHSIDVISEGLNGRTIAHDDSENPKNQRRGLTANGLQQLSPILYSHKPVDIVVIMLGINDTKGRFDPSPNKIAKNLDTLLQKCVNAEIWPVDADTVCHGPQIIVISPASIRTLTTVNADWGWTQTSINVSQHLHVQFSKIVAKYDPEMVHFVNANDFICTSGSDSVHIDADANQKLAMALLPIVDGIIDKLQNKARRFSVPSFTALSAKHHVNNLNEAREYDNDVEEEEDVEEREDSLSVLEQQRNGQTDIVSDKSKT